MSKRLTPAEESLKALLQEHGLEQPTVPFSTALTRLVVARYVPPAVVPYRAGRWLGNVLLSGLAGSLLLLLLLLVPPLLFRSVVGTCASALVLGLGGILWLLRQLGPGHHPSVDPAGDTLLAKQ
jgi:hypothetical protein